MTIRPRTDWAGDLDPTGPLDREDDVRFLLVHHTAGSNDYPEADVPGQLRRIYEQHTDVKGWPDVAYNFIVDRFGGVWETRAGSIDGPVRGDATGGSQGFAVLCCFLGDHSTEPPTAEAQSSMVRLLATLAGRYAVPVGPDATASFVSRGSNRWPQGAEVTTPTIAGHRQMSRTECPGDAAFSLVTDEFPVAVAERVQATSSPSTTRAVDPSTPSTTTSTTTSTSTSTTTAPSTTAVPRTSTSSTTATPNAPALAAGSPPAESESFALRGLLLPGGGVLALVGATLGAIWLRRRPGRA